jgi:hypothetical protein
MEYTEWNMECNYILSMKVRESIDTHCHDKIASSFYGRKRKSQEAECKTILFHVTNFLYFFSN